VGRKDSAHCSMNFLVPVHIMAEGGGVSISIREAAIPGDAIGETHSSWVLNLVATSGKTCTVTWRTFRRWNGSSVVYERHYDQQQSGGRPGLGGFWPASRNSRLYSEKI
jgi:hypothetical protein